jgi:hypothetical protein
VARRPDATSATSATGSDSNAIPKPRERRRNSDDDHCRAEEPSYPDGARDRAVALQPLLRRYIAANELVAAHATKSSTHSPRPVFCRSTPAGRRAWGRCAHRSRIDLGPCQGRRVGCVARRVGRDLDMDGCSWLRTGTAGDVWRISRRALGRQPQPAARPPGRGRCPGEWALALCFRGFTCQLGGLTRSRGWFRSQSGGSEIAGIVRQNPSRLRSQTAVQVYALSLGSDSPQSEPITPRPRRVTASRAPVDEKDMDPARFGSHQRLGMGSSKSS